MGGKKKEIKYCTRTQGRKQMWQRAYQVKQLNQQKEGQVFFRQLVQHLVFWSRIVPFGSRYHPHSL